MFKDPAIASPGPWLATEVSSTGTDGRILRLYTAPAADGVMQIVLLTRVGVFGNITRTVHAMMERATLKNPPPAPKRPEIVEAYRHPAMKKYITIDGGSFYGRVRYERILLLSNGVADFTPRYAEGYGENRDLLKIDAGTLNGWYGSWKADGKTVRIRRDPEKPEEVWEKVDGGLRYGSDVWTAMPRVDGLRLKGKYHYKSDPQNKPLQYDLWVEFTEEGAFKTGGLLSWNATENLLGRPKPPETVAGTYEIRDWTIWFKVNGATIWSTDLMTLKDDPKDLEALLFDTFGIRRQ